MLFGDPFEALFGLQRALDSFQDSPWLGVGANAGAPFPPVNVFRKGDDFVVVAEVPGVAAKDLEIQVKDNTIRIAGKKALEYPEKASLHRRERGSGAFDRTVTVPVAIDPDGVKAECRDGVLALYIPRAERDKPKTIKVS